FRSAREEVERRRRHRRVRRRAAGDLHDRGAELDPLGTRGEPAEDADRVGAPGLGDPDRVEAEQLRLLHERKQVGGIRAGRRVAEAQTQLHAPILRWWWPWASGSGIRTRIWPRWPRRSPGTQNCRRR